MGRFRFSLAKLLGAVVVVALGLGALVNATEWWAGVAVTCTLIALSTAVVGAVYRQKGARAFWFGFLVFGLCYFVLTWFSHVVRQDVTTRFIRYLHEQIQRFEHPAASDDHIATVWLRADGTVAVDGNVVLTGRPLDERTLAAALVQSRSAGKTEVVSYRDPGVKIGEGSISWAAERVGLRHIQSNNSFAVPSKGDFEVVGHSLFTLLFAFLGGLIARYFYATRERTT